MGSEKSEVRKAIEQSRSPAIKIGNQGNRESGFLDYWIAGLPASGILMQESYNAAMHGSALLRITGIIGLALLGGGIVLVGLIATTSSLTTYEMTPEHLLPAEETIALFSYADEALLRRFEPWFPILKTLPSSENTESIALLRMEDGSIGAAEFLQQSAGEDSMRIGRFAVIPSSSEVRDLLLQQSLPLRDSELFTQLLAQKAQGTSWVLLKLEALPTAEELPHRLLTAFLLDGNTHALLQTEEDGFTVELFSAQPQLGKSIPSTLRSLTAPSFFTASIANPASEWFQGTSALDEQSALPLHALVKQYAANAFGTQVSFQYDVLPLLQEPATLHLQQSSSGKLFFLLDGSLKDAKEVPIRLEKLHATFAADLPTVRETKRILDERFISEDVRQDTSLITEEAFLEENWHIRRTKHDEMQTGLFSARRRRRYLVSNDASLLQRAITDEEANKEGNVLELPTEPTLLRQRLQAGGRMDAEAMRALLEAQAPFFLSSTPSPLLPKLTGTVLWSVQQQRNVTKLIVRNERLADSR